MKSIFCILGGFLIGIITALLGFPIFEKDTINVKNLIIVICCTLLWTITVYSINIED